MIKHASGPYLLTARVFTDICRENGMRLRFNSDGQPEGRLTKYRGQKTHADFIKGMDFRLFFMCVTQLVQPVALLVLEANEKVERGKWEHWKGLKMSISTHPNVIVPKTPFEGLKNITIFIEQAYFQLAAAGVLGKKKKVLRFEELLSSVIVPEEAKPALAALRMKIKEAVSGVLLNSGVKLLEGGNIGIGRYVEEVIGEQNADNIFSIVQELERELNQWIDRDGHTASESTAHHARQTNQTLMGSAIGSLQATFKTHLKAVPWSDIELRNGLQNIVHRLEATRRGLRDAETLARPFSYSGVEELCEEIQELPDTFDDSLKETLIGIVKGTGFTIAFAELRFNSSVVDLLMEVSLEDQGLGHLLKLDFPEFQVALENNSLSLPLSGWYPGEKTDDWNWLLEHLVTANEDIDSRAGGMGDFIVANSKDPRTIVFIKWFITQMGLDLKIVALIEDKLELDVVSQIIEVADVIMIAASDLPRQNGMMMGLFLQITYAHMVLDAGKELYVGAVFYGELLRNMAEFHHRRYSEAEDDAEYFNLFEILGLNMETKLRTLWQTQGALIFSPLQAYHRLMPAIPTGYGAKRKPIPDFFKLCAESCFESYLRFFNDRKINRLYGQQTFLGKDIAISGRPESKGSGGTGVRKSEMPLVEGRMIGYVQKSTITEDGFIALGLGIFFRDNPEVFQEFKKALAARCPYAILIKTKMETLVPRMTVDRLEKLGNPEAIGEELWQFVNADIEAFHQAWTELGVSAVRVRHHEIARTQKRFVKLTRRVMAGTRPLRPLEQEELKRYSAISMVANRSTG